MASSTGLVQCRLLHHGASAASDRNVVTWMPSSSSKEQDESSCSTTLVYASHAIVNLASQQTVLLANGVKETVWNVYKTLRTDSSTKEGHKHLITSLCHVRPVPEYSDSNNPSIACGFSDGTINLWTFMNNEWTESSLIESETEGRSITALDGTWVNATEFLVIAGSSGGACLYHGQINRPPDCPTVVALPLLSTSVNGVRLRLDRNMGIVLLIGTAAPRHNKIHVYHQDPTNASTMPQYAGSLAGHDDWITSMEWSPVNNTRPGAPLLASGSQDARIRLWKFTTATSVLTEFSLPAPTPEAPAREQSDDDKDDDDEDLHHQEDEQDEEGESRLEMLHSNQRVTSVTLEALLMGHEESVTSVSWHPCPQSIYGQEHILVSSSMDRTILLWCPGEDGIWTPLSRVGSAGGILGGPPGSTLLGYCNAAMEPIHGRTLVGQAYGGALHFWCLNDDAIKAIPDTNSEELTTEDRAALIKWRATPCLTGHFDGVTDLCWEAESGAYLLTVSKDQTCRLWAPVPKADSTGRVWVEVSRPQVHGYDLSAVASLSTLKHPHLLVTGADEKELRAFDAPRTTLRVLKAGTGTVYSSDQVERVDRAYIPSLGLSNKASAAEGAEEDANADEQDRQLEHAVLEKMRLPLERDLGAVSLWPEVRKLFGHNTELYCLASNLAARTSGSLYKPPSDAFLDDVLVASSCKARDADAAAIRLWDVEQGLCRQVLSGHKSTVATLSFSPDGSYLASSGKDRRLCLWKRGNDGKFALAWAKDSAHKRILWSVHFCPFDETVLASGSRDGCIRLWKIRDDGENTTMDTLCSFAPSHHVNGKPDAVTALAFCPMPLKSDTAILACGLESGRIELWTVSLLSGQEPSLLSAFESSLCHIATVTKLAWKPLPKTDAIANDQATMLLASSSQDHGCRIFEVSISKEL